MGLEFESESSHVAHLTLHNPTQQDWLYRVDFYLGQTCIFWGRELSVPAGETRETSETIIMPSSPGEYPVKAQVWELTTGVYLGDFEFDTVTIVAPPVPTEEVELVWDAAQPFERGSIHSATFTIRNTSSEPFYHDYTWCSWLNPDNWDEGYAFWGLGWGEKLDPGESTQVTWPRTMSDVPGVYPHWVEIYDRYTGQLVGVVYFDDITLI